MSQRSEKVLRAKRIVVTRPAEQSTELVERLTACGAEVLPLPCIEIAPLAGIDQLVREALAGDTFDWTFFTSANAAQQFGAALRRFTPPIGLSGRFAAIGGKTARAAEKAGFALAFEAMPGTAEEFVHQVFAAHLQPRHVLYPASRLADGRFEQLLMARGVQVTRLNLYEPVSALDAEKLRRIFGQHPEAIIFYSPSAARSFFEALPAELQPALSKMQFAAIGKTTAEALQEHGIRTPLVAQEPKTEALIDALLCHFQEEFLA